MPANGKPECRAVQVARTFFKACTKLSDDDEDILPQVSDPHAGVAGVAALAPLAPASRERTTAKSLVLRLCACVDPGRTGPLPRTGVSRARVAGARRGKQSLSLSAVL